jgi:transcriptional repressor NrdR
VHCPFCCSTSSVVRDSRGSDVVRRRRFCTQCGEKFTTLECVAFPKLQVIKTSSTQEFDRSVLLNSIKAVFSGGLFDLEKHLEEIVVIVMKDLSLLRLRKIHSFQITDSVIKALRSIDKVAAVRFALFHKNFESLEQLLKFVEAL